MPGAFIKPRKFEQFRNPPVPRRRVHAGKRAIEIEHAPARHIGWESMIFRQITDGTPCACFPRIAAEDLRPAGRRMRTGEQHLHESRLPGAIRAEQSERNAAPYLQRDGVYGFELAFRPARLE